MKRVIQLLLTNKSVLLSFLFVLFFSSQVYSQSPLTNPTNDGLKSLLPGNIDPTQLTQKSFKEIFSDNNKKASDEGADKNKTQNSNNKVGKDTSLSDNIKNENQNKMNDVYGANIFSSTPETDVTELSTPPLDYPIGVGDHIVVALWGGGEYQEDYVVAKDGSIFPTGLGKITVQGLTFENARSLIYARFKSVVPATTNIQVTLGQPRTISVNVGGEVTTPGPVTISAFSNALNVIGKAGGITEFGNLREIQVKRLGKVIETLDVYEYLTTGDFGRHIYLQNNDFVLVKFVEKKVMASGQFKRPMYYQLKKNEGIKDLLRFCGGFTPDAYSSNVEVIRTENEQQVIHDVNANAIVKLSNVDFPLVDGDIVKADLIRPGILNKVVLKGDVKYPGNYELRKNDHLFDVLNRAGGIIGSTFLPRAYIFRSGKDSANLKVDKIEISLKEFNKPIGNENNILLQANDLIQLFSNNDFADAQSVQIFGEVRKEGKVVRYSGMTLQDLIYLSGGLKSSAEFGRVEVVSVVDIDSAQKGLKPTRTIVNTYSIQPNLELDSVSAQTKLKPFDQVFVRKNPAFKLQQNITINGLVKYPGIYSKIVPNEKLSSFIERAGGVLENADLSGAFLVRTKSEYLRENFISAYTPKPVKPDSNSFNNLTANVGSMLNTGTGTVEDQQQPQQPEIKTISIDLSKALSDKNSVNDIVLLENDVIYIPEKNPFVAVTGTVQSPLKITFDPHHERMNYYIDKAGGFGIRPWRKRLYVTYANGKSKRTKNIFIFHFYPRIKQGCTVTVPYRPQGKEIGDVIVQAVTATIPLLVAGIILKKI